MLRLWSPPSRIGRRRCCNSSYTAVCTSWFHATTSGRCRYPSCGGRPGLPGPLRLPPSLTVSPCDSSTACSSATRSASGPIEAPRMLAPISVGAPIRLTAALIAASASQTQARARADAEGAAEQIFRVPQLPYEVDLPPAAPFFTQQLVQETQGRIVLQREADGIKNRDVARIHASSRGTADQRREL